MTRGLILRLGPPSRRQENRLLDEIADTIRDVGANHLLILTPSGRGRAFFVERLIARFV